MPSEGSTFISPAQAQFPQTLWSVVLQAGAGDDDNRRHEALARLCQAYWRPAYVFLRKQGNSPQDAEDLTQGFFVHLLEKNRLENVGPEKGKFRSFLLTALKNFAADQWAKNQAAKRGGGAIPFSIDATEAEKSYVAEPAHYDNPEKLFERQWLMELLRGVLSKLEQECVSAGKRERFELLKPYLTGEGEGSYPELANRLGMTPGALKVAVLRLRHRYRELVEEELSHTVADEQQFADELRHLIRVIES